MPAYGNAPLTNGCHWHPRQDMVACRCSSSVIPACSGSGAGHDLRSFGIDERRKVLKPVLGELSETAILAVDFKAWKGAEFEFTVDVQPDHTPQLRWESASDPLRVLSDGAVK